MGKIIAVCNQKGGVAKTTTVCALATGLNKRGYNVLVCDCDPQRNATSVFRGETDGVATIHDLLFTKGISPEQCIQQTEIGDIIAGDSAMVRDDANLNGVRESLILKKALAPLRDKYDFILLDHNPGLNGILNNVQTAADEIIIPMQADLFSVEGAADMAERLASIQELTNPNLVVAGVLITFDYVRSVGTKDFLSQAHVLEAAFKTRVFKSRIRRCQDIVNANNNRMSIFDYAPTSNGASDYNALIDEYLNEVN